MGTDKPSALSHREKDTLNLTMAGLADKEIAANLGVSVHTVRTYWDRIREKIGKSTRAEVISEVARRRSSDSAVSELERRLAEVDSKRYQLELLLGRAPILVWSCDTSGHVIYVNDQFQIYAGQVSGSSVSDLFSRLTPPEMFLPLHEKAVAARQMQGVLEVEAPLRRLDGEMRWHLIRETPLVTQIDESFLRIGTATDIQVLLTRDLTTVDAATRSGLAADLSAIGIAYFDAASGKTYSNPAYDDLTGSADLTHDWTEAVHPEDRGRAKEDWGHSLIKSIPLESEHRYVGVDGRSVSVLAKVMSLPGKGWLFLGKRNDRQDRTVVDPEKLTEVVALLRDMLGFSKSSSPDAPSVVKRQPNHET